ncbi:agmatine deiminase family protein [candidate division KSB1 bacterium]|nr:agmatine deiminase family protein [candidate division KSB1 bacterium]
MRMKLLLCLLFFVFFYFQLFGATNSNINNKVIVSESSPDKILVPPTFLVRAMAEWESLKGILITWDALTEARQETEFPINLDITDIYCRIVALAQPEVTVYIICNDSNEVKLDLKEKKISITNIQFIIKPHNSVWCRDYGPWSVYNVVNKSLSLVDWTYSHPRHQDDILSLELAKKINIPIFSANKFPNDFLVLDGGIFMVDGHDTGISSNLLYRLNTGKSLKEMESLIYQYMGIKKMILLPFDFPTHIDLYIKLLDEETLLVGEYPPGEHNGLMIDQNLEYLLDNLKTCFNRQYKVIRIPMPPLVPGYYFNELGNFRTYLNSIIINKKILVPTYNIPMDEQALEIYRNAMPGYQVEGINCDDVMLSMGGGLHCLIREIGDPNSIFISHAKLANQPGGTDGYRVDVVIKSATPINDARVYWKTKTKPQFRPLFLQPTSIDTYAVVIPPQPVGETIQYYIQATNYSQKTLSKPMTAPSGFYEFAINSTLNVPGDNKSNTHSFYLSQNYPNPFNSSTTITYTLKKPGFVSLTIFNALGRKVDNPVAEFKSPGQYQLTWNRPNSSYLEPGTGVYFYELKVGQQSIRKKMILVK